MNDVIYAKLEQVGQVRAIDILKQYIFVVFLMRERKKTVFRLFFFLSLILFNACLYLYVPLSPFIYIYIYRERERESGEDGEFMFGVFLSCTVIVPFLFSAVGKDVYLSFIFLLRISLSLLQLLLFIRCCQDIGYVRKGDGDIVKLLFKVI